MSRKADSALAGVAAPAAGGAGSGESHKAPPLRGLHWFRGAALDLARRPPNNVPALDVLRTVAVLSVFTGHFGGEFVASPSVSKWPPFYYGWSGVDLFFVLSGLLIGTQLWREMKATGRIRIGRFLLRRGLRIWPLYFSFVGLLSAEVIFLGRPAAGLGADALFLSNYFHNQVAGGWSLSTEEQFYVLAPLSISILALALKPERGWVLPVAAFCLPVVARAIEAHGSTLNEYDLKQQLYFPFHTHSEGLALGLLLAWIAVFRPNSLTSRGRGIAAAAMLLTGGVLYASSRVLFNFSALALIYGAATCLGMGPRPRSRILNWHGFYLISRLSYGVYLNHFGLLPRLHAVLGGWRESGGEPAFWVCYVLCFLACLAFAAVTFQLIEWPFLRIRSRWLERASSHTTKSGKGYGSPNALPLS
jgi:peptidoglycan/LPS O-acetylase OafA/YrhL